MATFEGVKIGYNIDPSKNKTDFVDYESLQRAISGINSNFNKWGNYLLHELDHLNVTRLYTEYCQITSEAGETQIVGPLIKMYDKQAIPVLRLLEGYNSATSKFVHELYDTAGNKNFYVDDSGQIQLTGKPLLMMYDNQVVPVLRLKQGYDLATDKFVFNMYDTAGNNNVFLSDAGHFRLTGKPYIEMYDNQLVPVKRAFWGYEEVADDFLFKMWNKAGVLGVDLDSSGNLVLNTGTFKGDIITDANIYIGNNVYIGHTTGLVDKYIYMSNVTGNEAYIKMDSTGIFSFYTFSQIDMYCHDKFTLTMDDIDGSGYDFKINHKSGIGKLVLANEGTGSIVFSQNSVEPFISVTGSAVVNTLVLKAGNVGIGTASPGAKLQVNVGTNGYGTGLLVIGTGAITALSIEAATDHYPVLEFRENGVGKWQIYNDHATDNLIFYHWAGTAGVALTLTSNGYVGIAMTPSYPLDVTGQARFNLRPNIGTVAAGNQLVTDTDVDTLISNALSGYATQSWVSSNYATSGHNHGNAYIKSGSSQDINIQYFADHMEIQLGAGTVYSITYDP